ncbi:hypothetical protein F511_10942 [Dorcoceras hygrometricum]|uniref:Uncharacterized protein n=1 Tax=Dorcoceras hygrometricum TaxID=472368 RepID=A0A2Z7BKQ2_9LAMI|nr:hypothetical protein F511_10942 [Dorcoceras hygrometricum]
MVEKPARVRIEKHQDQVCIEEHQVSDLSSPEEMQATSILGESLPETNFEENRRP